MINKILLASFVILNCYANQALGLNGKGQTSEPIEAYACNNCDIEQARFIAQSEAPANNCQLYRNGSVAEQCEDVSRVILVPAIGSKKIYKFFVITSIDSNNQTTVRVEDKTPSTPEEARLIDEFFDLYNQLEEAVGRASNHEPQHFSDDIYLAKSQTTSDSCENHPINVFKSEQAMLDKKLQLTSRIIENMNGATPLEYSSDAFLSGGGIGISKGGVSIQISFQHMTQQLIVSEGDGLMNNLAFDVHLHTDGNGKTVVALTLNRLFTKIDGIQASDFFGPSLDLSEFQGQEISSCVDEFIDENTEIAEPTSSESGGS